MSGTHTNQRTSGYTLDFVADSIALKRLRKNIIRLKAAAGFRTDTELTETAKIGKNVLTGILKHGTGARWENLDALASALGVRPASITTGGEYDDTQTIKKVLEAIIRDNPRIIADILAQGSSEKPAPTVSEEPQGPRARLRPGRRVPQK